MDVSIWFKNNEAWQRELAILLLPLNLNRVVKKNLTASRIVGWACSQRAGSGCSSVFIYVHLT